MVLIFFLVNILIMFEIYLEYKLFLFDCNNNIFFVNKNNNYNIINKNIIFVILL